MRARVEHHDVGERSPRAAGRARAGGSCAPTGRSSCGPPARAGTAALAPVARQHAREGAPQPRVRMAVVRQAVGADHRAAGARSRARRRPRASGSSRRRRAAGGGRPPAASTPHSAAMSASSRPVDLGMRVGPGHAGCRSRRRPGPRAARSSRRCTGRRPSRSCWRCGERVDQRQRLARAAPVGGAGALVVRDHERHAGCRRRCRRPRACASMMPAISLRRCVA